MQLQGEFCHHAKNGARTPHGFQQLQIVACICCHLRMEVVMT